MAPNDADYSKHPPPLLAAHLRDAEAAIAKITGRIPGAKSAMLHAIFSHGEPIKDSIVRDAPAGQPRRYDHVDRVLQASFFLVLHALGPVQPTNSEAHFDSWWVELNGREQLAELAKKHGAGSQLDALDTLRRAKWEWTYCPGMLAASR
ncbi:hypothetical protein CC85DRAFT_17801 [Cutaneotrichosporon oleaginosum]|uniref:Uncharacterized protein n=1 Tax=Cutaneotrichosporon oleaginosum TaxID=879819 RepID=A0A0J0XTL6_9TREE|nr:uncharacterized protein CC85DRAFT_17801 [Cutaneotrichosporon oleaginosum]KLT44423.1 hypothetical protein CC85DRAFT_17801 [Cutaneotrichosporon oleaginosum]TXT07857.1 hypothetical protein COLE_04781 [Cutaneotrichosporon oleaginosum]